MVAHLVKVTIPNYLSGLPIPDSVGGIFKLSFRDLLSLIPPTAAVAGFTYITYRAFVAEFQPKSGKINLTILKDKDKVVDTVEIENLADKACMCRCWKSTKFPYCDGSHNAHNKETGDNVGPLIIKAN